MTEESEVTKLLLELLDKHFEKRMKKLKEEQEALDAANTSKPSYVVCNLYRVLNQAINNGEIENISIISQAIQRLK